MTRARSTDEVARRGESKFRTKVRGTHASSKRWTRYASAASCSAIRASACMRRSDMYVVMSSRITRANGNRGISRFVVFWNFRISRRATMPGRARLTRDILCGFSVNRLESVCWEDGAFHGSRRRMLVSVSGTATACGFSPMSPDDFGERGRRAMLP